MSEPPVPADVHIALAAGLLFFGMCVRLLFLLLCKPVFAALLMHNVLKQIHDPDCRLLLEMRYLAFKSWEEISEIMHLHIRSTYKMHGRALKAVEEIINAPGFESVIKLGS